MLVRFIYYTPENPMPMCRYALLAACSAMLCAAGDTTSHKAVRIGPRDFAVMAWSESPSDPELLRGMKEAGLNITGFCRTEDLAKVNDAGLTCFVSDPRVNGYDWKKLPAETEIRQKIGDVARQVGANPAALGFYLQDEPHASAMKGMGTVVGILRELMPGKLPYVNLFPYRVSAERLGTLNYDSYVKMLVDVIHQPFLSYDNYSLVNNEMLDSFFSNLEIVRRLGLETRTPFWNCILANAHFNYMEPSDATFHLQVYSTLAYGGRGIEYFTYFTPDIGNYRLGAVDQFGNRTRTWDMLRRVNNEIHALAPAILKLGSTGVYHSPDVPEEGKPLSQSRLIRQINMTQSLARAWPAARFLVGEFEDTSGRPYFMVVNKSLTQSYRFAVELKNPGNLIRVNPYSGQEEPFHGEMDWLAPGGGVLLRIG
jgi:hypothetical protein